MTPHASASRTGPRTHWRSTRCALGTTRRLSKLAAHSVGIPSSGPSRSSLGIIRTVRVIGAASNELRTGIAASRVMTRNGRRPTSATSPHQTSPRRGSVTRVLRQSLREATRERQHPPAAWLGFACTPRPSTGRALDSARSVQSLLRLREPLQRDFRRRPSVQGRQASKGARLGAARLSGLLTCKQHTISGCAAKLFGCLSALNGGVTVRSVQGPGTEPTSLSDGSRANHLPMENSGETRPELTLVHLRLRHSTDQWCRTK